MKPHPSRSALMACMIAVLPGCGTSEAQKREETAEIAKKALSDTSARLEALKGGKALDKDGAGGAAATPSANGSAPD